MPLRTPSSSKPGAKPKTLTSSSKDSAARKSPSSKKSASPVAPQPETVASWWASLSPERKLDVVGVIMSLVGLLIMLILFSAQRSDFTGGMMHLLTQIFGWGIYILPVGLIVMGLWLIFRRIEKLRPLSLERATVIIFFFLCLLSTIHSIIPRAMADQAVILGIGGGYIGSLLSRILFNSFGTWGTIIALAAWLLITITMTFNIFVEDLFRWVNPLMVKIRAWLATPIVKTNKPSLPENQ